MVEEGSPVIFNMNKLVDGDILLRVRHFVSSEVRYPVLRVMLNTCMIVERSTRFHSSELDLGDNIFASKDFFIDVIT